MLRILFDTGYQQAAIAANVLLTSLSAFLVHLLARKASGLRCAPALAGIIYVVYPATLGIELRIGVEAIFTFLLLCFLLLLLRAVQRRTMRAFALSGVMLGVASYTRSTALLFPVFLLFLPPILKMPRRMAVRAWLGAVLVLVCALGALTPWMLRNERLVGRPIATASVQGVSMQVE